MEGGKERKRRRSGYCEGRREVCEGDGEGGGRREMEKEMEEKKV